MHLGARSSHYHCVRTMWGRTGVILIAWAAVVARSMREGRLRASCTHALGEMGDCGQLVDRATRSVTPEMGFRTAFIPWRSFLSADRTLLRATGAQCTGTGSVHDRPAALEPRGNWAPALRHQVFYPPILTKMLFPGLVGLVAVGALGLATALRECALVRCVGCCCSECGLGDVAGSNRSGGCN